MASYEYVNGKMVEIPDIVIDHDTTLTEVVNSTVIIRGGASVVTQAKINGTVNIESGTLVAQANVSGTVHVMEGASATFEASMGGTLRVDRGGEARIAQGASALGTMRINGVLVNDGSRGGQVSGSGTIDDRPGSAVRTPDRQLPNSGVAYYS